MSLAAGTVAGACLATVAQGIFQRDVSVLAILSDTPILSVEVEHDGRRVDPWQDILRREPRTLAFANLPARGAPVTLRVRWRTHGGEGDVSERVGFDSEPRCLFTLRLDAHGAPVSTEAGRMLGVTCAGF
ncbi:MAG: hypothetical protein K2X11_04705 [Acetobacteraceae bacterium]|nr:hypothetical protein [Acetobacteraceae bacterium]